MTLLYCLCPPSSSTLPGGLSHIPLGALSRKMYWSSIYWGFASHSPFASEDSLCSHPNVPRVTRRRSLWFRHWAIDRAVDETNQRHWFVLWRILIQHLAFSRWSQPVHPPYGVEESVAQVLDEATVRCLHPWGAEITEAVREWAGRVAGVVACHRIKCQVALMPRKTYSLRVAFARSRARRKKSISSV